MFFSYQWQLDRAKDILKKHYEVIGLQDSVSESDFQLQKYYNCVLNCLFSIAFLMPCEEVLQSDAIITPSNITRYCFDHCCDCGKYKIRAWSHNKHPVTRPNVLCEDFGDNWTRYNGTALYISKHVVCCHIEFYLIRCLIISSFLIPQVVFTSMVYI